MAKNYLYLDEKMEKLPWSELTKLHEEKIKKTINHMWNNNQYLQNKIKKAGRSPDDFKTVDDITKFPFMEKKDFLDTYPYGLLCVPRNTLVRMHATSGTSGKKPTVGLYTRNDLEAWTNLTARNLVGIGMTNNDVFQNTTSSGLFTGGYGYTQGATRVGAMVIPFGGGMSAKQIQFFIDFQVTTIHAIPSFALRLGEQVAELGLDPVKDLFLKRAIIGAEGWSESTRQRIEKGLNIKAYDNYGLTEGGGPGVACECLEQKGLHIWSDHFFAEVIDPATGELLGEGERGELVLTSLFKEAMPILRYRTGDITAIHKSECPCGRTGWIMDRISGRKDEMLIVKGVNLYPSMIEEEVYKLPGTTDNWEMLIKTEGVLDHVYVTVEGKSGTDFAKIKADLEKNLYEAAMMKIPVTVVPAGTLPVQEGKAKRYKDLREKPDDFRGYKGK
ncbi:MAG: phenylacetate--CoA ligase family protein [Candidatus Sigynarchaeum springense]